MDTFNIESRQSIYFEIRYVIAVEWLSDTLKRLDFQRALADKQLDFPQTGGGAKDFTLVRKEPSALQVKIASLGPRVSSISVSSERPAHTLELFSKEAEAVCEAYRQAVIKGQCQLLQCGARIRHLYSCREHAFKYLWEDRLCQDPQDFRYLGGRPVLGGGLRLFMPPVKLPAQTKEKEVWGPQEDEEPVQIEVKIESFLQEAKKMFVETLFAWPKPRLLSEDEMFDAEFRLKTTEDYATGQVCDFILKSKTER